MPHHAPARHLPVVFQSLDIESKTKPAPLVMCPNRHGPMTVSGCGACRDFQRIEFTESGLPVLACFDERAPRPAGLCHAVHRTVQEVVRLPHVCAAEDTTLGYIRHALVCDPVADLVPVLDRAAKPVGILSMNELRRLLTTDIPLDVELGDLMRTRLLCVSLDTTFWAALRLLIDAQEAELLVVGPRGVLAGIAAARDMI